MSKAPEALYLPSTFEERGTAAPFTTPALNLARVRPDEQHGLVLLMPDFSGSGQTADSSIKIIPWRAVPELAVLSVHDRALHEEILASGAVTPEAMRQAGLKMAETGLAGAEAAAAAARALAEDTTRIAETRFLLILELLNEAGLPMNSLFQLGADPEAGDWRGQATDMLTEAAHVLKLDADALQQRLTVLARVLAPVGLANLRMTGIGQSGRLRRLAAGLERFRQSVVDWGALDVSEMGPFGLFAGRVADNTLTLADAVLAQLDQDSADLVGILRDEDVRVRWLARLAGRLSWLLDGWDYIIGIWDAAASESVLEKRQTMVQLMRVLPLVPRLEGAADGAEQQLRDTIFRNRLSQPAQPESAGYDVLRVNRIEQVKARVLPE